MVLVQRKIMTKAHTTVTKVTGKKAARKAGEVWRISSDGKVKVLTTRRTSIDTMDEAVKLYGRALKRLAHR
jgi:hypothetical protein